MLTPQFNVRLHDESFHSYRCEPPANEIATTKEELIKMYDQMVSGLLLLLRHEKRDDSWYCRCRNLAECCGVEIRRQHGGRGCNCRRLCDYR